MRLDNTDEFTMASMCQGCVFFSGSSYEYIGRKIRTNTQYSNDYTRYGEIFAAYTLNESGKYYCIEANAPDQSNNKKVLNHFFTNCNENKCTGTTTKATYD